MVSQLVLGGALWLVWGSRQMSYDWLKGAERCAMVGKGYSEVRYDWLKGAEGCPMVGKGI